MLSRVMGTAASGIDRAFAAAVLRRSERSRRRSKAESLGHADRMVALGQIAALYEDPTLYEPSGLFYPAPPVPDVRTSPSHRVGGRRVVDVDWPTAFEPYVDELAPSFARHPLNQRAAARLILHDDRPRPTVVLLHGYLGGAYEVEQRMWPLDWLLRMGLDVAFAVLPFHGVRGRPLYRARPPFPSSDPRMTNETFRQAVGDVRSLLAWLLDRGAPAVGVMGMSLGGYTASLVATVEPRLAFAVPLIPLASLADIARATGRLVGTESEQAQQHGALETAHRVISPFSRPSRLGGDRVRVLAGRADRITPISHARRLAEHFDAPLVEFAGGHLFQFGRGEAFREVGRMLATLGLTTAARR